MIALWHLAGRLAFWATWPALWVYLRNTKRTRVVVTSGDKVLLVKVWLGAGEWILPGGGMHRGEDPVAAAIREVREETGVSLDPESVKAVGNRQVREYGFPYTAVLYQADLPSAADLRKQRLEVTEVAWVSKQDASELSPLTRELLADWL